MKKLSKIAILVVLAGVTVTSCKKEEKRKPAAVAVEDAMEEQMPDSAVVVWVDSYPDSDSLNAQPVVADDTMVSAEPVEKADPKKSKEQHKKEAKPTAPKKDYNTGGGHLVTNQNDDLVGGLLIASTSEKDTLELHFTEVDTVFTPENKSKRRMKGYGYIQNRKYSFDQPVNVTKSQGAIGINDTIMLTPEVTDVAMDGAGSQSTDVEKGDPYRVIVRTRSDKSTVVKLKDLKTDVKTKKIYDKHGDLVKTHTTGGTLEEREAQRRSDEAEMEADKQ